ncbi:UBN2_2 domain-containing protein, partial [Cephalotus follicularis]
VTNQNFSSWIKTDRLIKGWITGTLAEEVLGQAIGTKSSMELWSALKEAFSPASEVREFELQSKLQYHQKTESMTITEYLSEFKSIFDQLNSIGKPVPDKRKVFLLLTNLGSSYEAFSTTMLKPPVRSYSEIITILRSHELRNKNNKPVATNQSMASYTNAGNKGKGRGSNTNSFSSKGRGFSQTVSRTPQQTFQTPLQHQQEPIKKNDAITKPQTQKNNNNNGRNTIVCPI